MNNFDNKSVLWVEVGVPDYIIFEHLVRPDKQGDTALVMGYSEPSQRFTKSDVFLFESLSMVIKISVHNNSLISTNS